MLQIKSFTTIHRSTPTASCFSSCHHHLRRLRSSSSSSCHCRLHTRRSCHSCCRLCFRSCFLWEYRQCNRPGNYDNIIVLPFFSFASKSESGFRCVRDLRVSQQGPASLVRFLTLRRLRRLLALAALLLDYCYKVRNNLIIWFILWRTTFLAKPAREFVGAGNMQTAQQSSLLEEGLLWLFFIVSTGARSHDP